MCLHFVLCVGRIGIEGVELHTLHNCVVKQLGYDVTPVTEDVEGIYVYILYTEGCIRSQQSQESCACQQRQTIQQRLCVSYA